MAGEGLLDWAGDDRVTLAIVFTDIVGSTALGVQLGDQRMEEVRAGHFRRSDALIAKYRGRQVKTIGDSVMAVFRSVGAAFDYAYALHLDPGVEELRASGVRAGIHNGEACVAGDDIFGRDVNFAARVGHAIAGAEIWLSGRAREALESAGARHRQALQWEQHDDVELKGFGKYPLWSLIPNPEAPSEEPVVEPEATPAETATRPAPPPATPNNRVIFVAQPSADMRLPYTRIVGELRSRGFAVVPDGEMPGDGAAAFFDTALAAAELSIHLLGAKSAYTEDGVEAVGFQLARAARRVRAAAAAGSEEAEAFRRIVWAPKYLDDSDGTPSGGEAQRDPLAVLERFGEQLPSDKVPGENLTQFINFLYQHLERRKPRSAAVLPQIASGDKIFIDHAIDDLDYADELAEALQGRSFTPVLPTLEGKPNLVTQQNKKKMQDCKVVALCWGSTSEQWVMAHADYLDRWRRGTARTPAATLLAVPPKGRYKERWLRIKPPGIDHVIDMTGIDKPSPTDLDKWLADPPNATAGDG